MITASKFKLALTFCMAALLTGCQIGTKIKVAQIDELTVFVVERNDGDPTCVKVIDVSEKIGDKFNNIWLLRKIKVTDDDALCQNVFIFGKPHTGFTQEALVKSLEPGKTYYVSISGGGLTGDRTFTVTP
jgi:predicted RNA-binding protein with TRAM domain